MAEVDVGLNVYDFNKNIIRQLPVKEDLSDFQETLENYLGGVDASQFLMMLCREKNDYTLFNFQNGWGLYEVFAQDVIECLLNRGYGVVEYELVNDNQAIEIWVKRPNQMEDADVYYIFPADQMVINY